MKKKIEKTFALVAALSCLCAPTALMIVGFWMIYNVGLQIGLALSIAGFIGTLYVYYVNMVGIEEERKN